MALCDRCDKYPCTTNTSVLMQRYCPAFSPNAKPPTNADRFRSMTDEEMAEFFGSIVQDWHQGTAQIGDRIIDSWLDWLKQEATE